MNAIIISSELNPSGLEKPSMLKELGSEWSKSEELHHVMLVLIFTYTQTEENRLDFCLHTKRVKMAVQRCAEYYGVSFLSIYNDCKRVTGIYTLRNFSLWTAGVLFHENLIRGYTLSQYFAGGVHNACKVPEICKCSLQGGVPYKGDLPCFNAWYALVDWCNCRIRRLYHVDIEKKIKKVFRLSRRNP